MWLIARVYLGWQWLTSGWGKLDNPAWMETVMAVRGFWERAATVPESGRPVAAYDWYRGFLQFMLDIDAHTWFAPMIVGGEILVGIGLLLGALTGIAAFFNAFMNMNFMLAGTASTNPVMALIALGIVIAWKIAGWWGVDRVLLPALGAPWQPGRLFDGRVDVATGEVEPTAVTVERWVRVLLGVAIALYALTALTGPLQVILLLLAGVLVAVTGMGWFTITGGRMGQGFGSRMFGNSRQN
ncbi:MAG: DoxX family membrane protein [Dehalococcoidia bacterium]